MLYLSDLRFEYPKELIATSPKPRGKSRILSVYREYPKFEEINWTQLEGFFKPGDVLVLNDSKVLPSRLLFKKESGAEAEVLFLGCDPGNPRIWSVMTRNLNLKSGKRIGLPGNLEVQVKAQGLISKVEVTNPLFNVSDLRAYFEKHGQLPVPPYILAMREGMKVTAEDSVNYQTAWADKPGSSAAPTAGLHFSAEFLDRLRGKGVSVEFVTLHVGAGTFLPISTENIDEFQIHAETVIVSAKVCESILKAKAKGKSVWACGTTAVRALETAALAGRRAGQIQLIQPFEGETSLFIKPSYRFHVVDGMITNFHQPESSLLALVAAFASRDVPTDRFGSLKQVEKVMNAYQFAIDRKFRLFSYGDFMVIYP